jgi:uncharacterized membrane protein YjjP (DUF1212 family)
MATWFSRRLASILKSAATDARIDEVADHETLDMLSAFALAMLETGQATNDVEETLRTIAQVYGLEKFSVVVLPTFVILQAHEQTAEFSSARPAVARLDQAGAVELLTARALRRELAPMDAVTRLSAALAARPRFGWALSLLGHVILTIGFGMVINPVALAIPAYAVLGLGVGLLILLARRFTGLAAAVPVVAAFAVTIVTTLWLSHLVGDSALRIIAPPLVSFLPGGTLTIAAIELTSNQVISGASRLVYGVAQLLLLTFGVFAASTIVGGLHAGHAQQQLGWWGGLVGVALVAVGFTLFMSAPRGAFVWLVVALAVSYGAQVLGVLVLGAALSGFFGAVVVAPFARFASRFRGAPPASVMSLACFWLLVPGALGFIGLSGIASSSADALQTLTTAGLSVLAIALGAIVGVGVSRDAGRLRRLARRRA